MVTLLTILGIVIPLTALAYTFSTDKKQEKEKRRERIGKILYHLRKYHEAIEDQSHAELVSKKANAGTPQPDVYSFVKAAYTAEHTLQDALDEVRDILSSNDYNLLTNLINSYRPWRSMILRTDNEDCMESAARYHEEHLAPEIEKIRKSIS